MKYLMALAIGSIGGWLFSLIHFPLPWTLGPLVAVVMVKVCFRYSVVWPAQIRNIAMAVLGYTMGRSFNPEAAHNILRLLPYVIIATILTVLLSLLVGVLTGKYTRLNLTTSLFGSIPGGLSQMATICESMEGADVSAITFMQTIRMLEVVFLVPLVASHGLARNMAGIAPAFVPFGILDIAKLAIFGGLIALLIYISKYLKLSGSYVIMPIIGTAVLVLSGIDAPAVPSSFTKLAQVFVGIRMGMGINPNNLANWKRILLFSLLGNLSLLGSLFAMDYVLAKIAPISFLTTFIATAPGGMAEMGLTAMAVKADLSAVISFQLFRILFILLAAIPLLSWWLRRHSSNLMNKTNAEFDDFLKPGTIGVKSQLEE